MLPSVRQPKKYFSKERDSWEPSQLDNSWNYMLIFCTFSIVPAANPTTTARPFQAMHFKASKTMNKNDVTSRCIEDYRL